MEKSNLNNKSGGGKQGYLSENSLTSVVNHGGLGARGDVCDEDGLTNGVSTPGVHMMREIPSDAAFQTSGGATGPGGSNDTDDSQGWDSKTHFMLSVVGYSVGLGNIWRFPYLCQQNGGGAFLIPFLIMVILEGAPLLLIELGIGQRLRQGSLGTWNMIHPSIGGIGIASTIVAFFVGLYYNVIITWCFFYLFHSFRATLPWAECPLELSSNGTMVKVPECEKSSETAYFWYREALDISPSIEETGGIKWWMLLCLLLAWVVVYFIIMRGVKSAGKAVYFTALFPYLVLTIFFIRGVTLKGAKAGVMHMYTPKMEKLYDLATWMDAATQVFYSFGLAFGSLIAFGSYNKPRNNCIKDVIFITCTNAATAMYASIVIFSVLGFKATAIHDRCIEHNKFQMHLMNSTVYPSAEDINESVYDAYINEHFPDENYTGTPFEDCSLEKELDSAAAGTGLAFVVFTQAIVELPASPFWSIIFFLMLLALGLGSQIGTMEGVVNTVFESPYFSHIRKEILTAVVCFVSFLGGLIFVTGAGEYWVSLFDGYASTTGLVIIALLEIVSVMYIYGHERFTSDLEYMTGQRPGLYWQVTWRFLGPITLVLLLAGSFYEKIKTSPNYVAWNSETGQTQLLPFPGWTMGVALFLIILGVLPIVVVWLMNVFNILGPSGRARSASTTMRRIDTSASTRPMMDDFEGKRPESVVNLKEYGAGLEMSRLVQNSTGSKTTCNQLYVPSLHYTKRT